MNSITRKSKIKNIVHSVTLFENELSQIELFGRKFIIKLQKICDGPARIQLKRGQDLLLPQEKKQQSLNPRSADNQTPRLLNEYQTAAYLGMSVYYLRNSHTTGPLKKRTAAPPFIKLGHRVRYHKDDLDPWLAKNKKLSNISVPKG